MSAAAWVVLLAITVPATFLVLYLFFDDSIVRIPPGKVGLLLIKGKATRRALAPGPHIVPAFRRRTVQEYPSLELSYRGGDTFGPGQLNTEFERSGPPVQATLGDRTDVTVSFTIRFRLEEGDLKSVHERFGPEGIWSAVRDEAGRTIADTLGDPKVGLDDLFRSGRRNLQDRLAKELKKALDDDGFKVTFFSFSDVDLGRTGEVIQAIVRSSIELEREQAEAKLRLARARNDAELAPLMGGAGADAALRYREADVWREFAHRPEPITVTIPVSGRAAAPTATTSAEAEEGEGATRE